MKVTKTLFYGIALLAAIIVTGAAIWQFAPGGHRGTHEYAGGKYGAFLAAQHAIYINDFDTAAKMSAGFSDRNLAVVRNTIVLSDFLAGRLPDDPDIFSSDSIASVQLVHDAYLLKKNDWAAIYARHKKDESAIAAPLRIWSGVAIGKVPETLKFIDTLKTNDSWKAFVRGQIYAETGKPEQAAQQFAKVQTDFLNINDYLYLLAFYKAHDMDSAAAGLRADFTARPGGMFMLDYTGVPDFADYSGFPRALAFSLIQNVSHTAVMMYSDLSLLLLRFAQIAKGEPGQQNDAINYYLGQYFFNNGGDFKKYLGAIGPESPFYPFAVMKIAEKTGKISELERAVQTHPLFVPAISRLVAKNVQAGNRRGALRVINRALDNSNLTDPGRAFFLKARAQVYLTFGDLDAAQADIRGAADILHVDADILAIQAKIWAAQKRELDTAYEYAIALVRKNPSDIDAWDVMGAVVAAREGAPAALEILERVGQIAMNHSSLFAQMGDLYRDTGNDKLARDAYLRALDLSEDGLTIVPRLQKKIKGLK